jgi:3-oxoacyl-[acyl-carrier protein] reductase
MTAADESSAPARVALVTGASSGIGYATAVRLLREGYGVGMLARPSARLTEAVAKAGAGAFAVGCDLGRLDEIERAVRQAAAAAGRLDVLVNCGSATRAGSVLSSTDEEWVSAFEVKVFGALRMTRAAWPHLCKAGGCVVNIGGIGARTPRDAFAMTGPLSASLMALTKVFADRGLVDGVRVNAVNPGAVLTPRTTAMLAARAESRGLSLENEIARMVERDEVTRLGRPEDVAGVVAFLLSPEGEWFQGAVLDVDGGRTKGL